jgi:hypothetical protein
MKNLESACKTFDSLTYPWTNRKSFAGHGLNDKTRLLDAIDELIRKTGESKKIKILADIPQQQLLIDSLRFLATETGMFRKLKPKWGEANTTVKRLLNDHNFPTSEVDQVNTALASAEKGLDFWNSLSKLGDFLNDAGINEIKNEIVPVWNTETFSQRLSRMKESLVNFDLIQEYDTNKASLNHMQRELLDICKSKLMDRAGWSEILQQELYVHWIEVIERENPVLRNQPFETYLSCP